MTLHLLIPLKEVYLIHRLSVTLYLSTQTILEKFPQQKREKTSTGNALLELHKPKVSPNELRNLAEVFKSPLVPTEQVSWHWTWVRFVEGGWTPFLLG